MAKTGTNSEIRSEQSVVPKPKIFMQTNTTFDNIRVYIEWKIKLLETELAEELKLKAECCLKRRPRCRLCHEKRCYFKYDSLRRKFMALTRILSIKGGSM